VRLPEVLGAEGARRLFEGLETWDEAAALQARAVHRVLAAQDTLAAVEAWLEAHTAI